MIELERHIEVLLLDNDCVIVPDFGGFVAHHVSARYDIEERLFLPPLRTLGFNPQLRINDSLLVQSYVDAYDISYPEALRRIEDEVSEVKRVLSNEGCYNMGSIGMLTVNQEGNYEFEPSEAGVLSPTLYGLSSYSFPLLKDKVEHITPQVQHAVHEEYSIDVAPVSEQPTDTALPNGQSVEEPTAPSLLEFTSSDSDDDRAIEIKMSWVRNAIAVAAAVVAFFLMVTPVANSDLGSQTMSKLNSNILYRLMPKDTNITPKTEPVQVAVKAKENAAKPQEQAVAQKDIQVKPTESAKAEVKPSTKPTYCIVVASQVKKSNAELFVEKLHQQGYKDATVYIHNNIVRVICGEYATEAEAYAQLNKMNVHEEFYEAWVYKKTAEV